MTKLAASLTFHKRSVLTLLLIILFIWSLFAVQWNSELIHPGGEATILQVFHGLFHPDLSKEILYLGLQSAWITLAYASAGMMLAIIIGVSFGILASGVLFVRASIIWRGFFRGLLGFMRAIHELVWAWLFVASFGLSPYAAIFALAIPYGGILGRIFADLLNDVPKEPIEALRSSGASKSQLLMYGYFPLVRIHIISYTMYRFECAVRSSAIMSFVGLGGLGYQIQLSLNDLNYDEVWTFLSFLILLVVFIDAWSTFIRKNLNIDTHHAWKNHLSILAVFFLLASSWIYIYVVENASLLSLFTKDNADYAQKFFLGMFGVGEAHIAFLDLESWKNALKLTYETLRMSIIAIGLSTIVMFFTVLPAARNIANGELILSNRTNWLLYGFIRLCYIFSRAIPELVWAMIIIFIFNPGILPGAIALALHNFGILGKLCAEVIEDTDQKPIRHLTSSGASKGQLLIYGVLPSVLPQFLTYILYRWEVIMRTTIVVGFVGAGGLGLQFKLSMSYFNYTDITLLLFCYMLLVGLADFISESSRKLVK